MGRKSLFERILAANDADQKEYDRQNKQNMDEPTDGVNADNAEKPKYEQYDSNGYKHT